MKKRIELSHLIRLLENVGFVGKYLNLRDYLKTENVTLYKHFLEKAIENEISRKIGNYTYNIHTGHSLSACPCFFVFKYPIYINTETPE